MTVETFQPRFIAAAKLPALASLWHLSRAATNGRHERLLWTSKHFANENPEVSPTAAYKDLCAWLAWN